VDAERGRLAGTRATDDPGQDRPAEPGRKPEGADEPRDLGTGSFTGRSPRRDITPSAFTELAPLHLEEAGVGVDLAGVHVQYRPEAGWAIRLARSFDHFIARAFGEHAVRKPARPDRP